MCPTSVQMHVYHFHRVWRHLLVLFLLESSPWTGPTSLGGSPCWTRAMSHKKIPGWWPERTACKWSWKASAAHKHHPPESSQGNAGWREGWTPARHTALSSKGNNVTCHSPVGIGWSDEEDADQLGEHDGVGQVRAEDPEGQRSAVQVGEWGSYSPYDHYGEADHPLQLFLWYLNRTPKLIFPKISTQTFKNSAFWPTLFLPDA